MHAFDPAEVAGRTRGGIDNVDYVDGLPGLVVHPLPTIAPHGAPLLVSGWTVDPGSGEGAERVCVLIDRILPLEARTGIARGDIMKKYDTDEFVGYQVVVGTGHLAPGAHELRVFALGSDGFWHESADAGFRLYHPPFPSGTVLDRTLQMFVRRPSDISAGIEIPEDTAIRANRWIMLQGWTYDCVHGAGAPRIAATDATGRRWSGPSNLERPDVAKALGCADDRLGFEIAIPAAVLERGRHELEIFGYDHTGSRYSNGLATTIDVIGAERPFPLTARCSSEAPAYAAKLRAIRADPNGPAVTTLRTLPLPMTAPLVAGRDDHFIVEGWALDSADAGADEVFFELTTRGVAIPPQRLPALSAMRKPLTTLPHPPVADAWFRFEFKTGGLPALEYELALIVIQPGRNRYSRWVLGDLTLRY